MYTCRIVCIIYVGIVVLIMSMTVDVISSTVCISSCMHDTSELGLSSWRTGKQSPTITIWGVQNTWKYPKCMVYEGTSHQSG